MRNLILLLLCLRANGATIKKDDPSKGNDVALEDLGKPNDEPIKQSDDGMSSAESLKSLPYPFIASLQLKEKGKYTHLCGAVVLDESFVLTAAHCFIKHANLKAEDLFVAAGSSKLYDAQAKRFSVKTFTKHPQFQPFAGFDVAVVQLATPMPIDNVFISTLDFRDAARKPGNVDVTLVGWGRTKPNVTKELETLPFRTITNEDCIRYYRFNYLTNTDVCAVNTAGTRGACDGDSGSPLVDEKHKMLYGLLSYGRKACEAGKPYAFTRTSSSQAWIKQTICQMEGGRKLRELCGRKVR